MGELMYRVSCAVMLACILMLTCMLIQANKPSPFETRAHMGSAAIYR